MQEQRRAMEYPPPVGHRVVQQGVGEAPPPMPTEPPRSTGDVNLRVSNRLLWVDGAVYPLQNVVRVYTTTVKPRRREVIQRFVVKAVLFLLLGGLPAVLFAAPVGFLKVIGVLIYVGIAIAAVQQINELRQVLRVRPLHVLAVDTSGMSTAVVTSSNRAHLEQLVRRISDAIEKPSAEFQVMVQELALNPKHYHIGDNVNMYGGSGNVGVKN
ncbi:DUF6232 family protein [Streptomyces sp. NPDC088353]|uniref:DUF6232 family protein n=1 Tax=Streptomyces sp. NPDC088353 TaxID=3365855 RepID=UPI00381468F6